MIRASKVRLALRFRQLGDPGNRCHLMRNRPIALGQSGLPYAVA